MELLVVKTKIKAISTRWHHAAPHLLQFCFGARNRSINLYNKVPPKYWFFLSVETKDGERWRTSISSISSANSTSEARGWSTRWRRWFKTTRVVSAASHQNYGSGGWQTRVSGFVSYNVHLFYVEFILRIYVELLTPHLNYFEILSLNIMFCRYNVKARVIAKTRPVGVGRTMVFSVVLADETGNIRLLFWTSVLCERFLNEIQVRSN